MEDLPQPLVPADVDLRGYEYMPLFGDRLFKSETWIAASPEAKVAALRLWWHSYAHEVPAASLPDNDTLLAEYAGYGVALKAWLRVKAQVMRGFVRCNDGRLYHEHVATWAMEAWGKRLKDRKRKADWLERQAAEKAAKKATAAVAAAAMAAAKKTVPEQPGNGSGTVPERAKGTERIGTERNGTDDKEGKTEALSGKPDPDPPPPAGDAKAERVKQLRKEAVGILLFLNEKTGRNYDATAGPNVDLVVGRLKQGATVDKCRQVIARMARKWTGDEKMDQYLRPKTLFGATNFAQYAGEIVDQPGGDE